MIDIDSTIFRMAKGNPGATTVLIELIMKEDGFLHALKFDDYNIYGSKIWLCFKDLCGQDIDKLYELLKTNKLQDAIKEKYEQDEYFKRTWDYHD